jgi:hypothetical protein
LKKFKNLIKIFLLILCGGQIQQLFSTTAKKLGKIGILAKNLGKIGILVKILGKSGILAKNLGIILLGK